MEKWDCRAVNSWSLAWPGVIDTNVLLGAWQSTRRFGLRQLENIFRVYDAIFSTRESYFRGEIGIIDRTKNILTYPNSQSPQHRVDCRGPNNTFLTMAPILMVVLQVAVWRCTTLAGGSWAVLTWRATYPRWGPRPCSQGMCPGCCAWSSPWTPSSPRPASISPSIAQVSIIFFNLVKISGPLKLTDGCKNGGRMEYSSSS